MPIDAPPKLVATINNLLHLEVCLPVVGAQAVAEKIRLAVEVNNLGSYYTGAEKAALLAFCEDLNALVVDSPVLAGMAEKYRPDHEDNSRPAIDGVNT